MAAKIKKDDDVIVIAGKDKGKQGKVLKILKGKRGKDFKVLVEGVNIIKKHTRGNPQKGTKGGIVEKEAPLNLSNIALVDPATGKASRVGFKILEDGRKVRFLKSSGEVIDV